MLVKPKNKLDIGVWLLVIAALLAGFLIQLLLGMARYREEAAVSRRVALAVASDAGNTAQALTERRRAAIEEAAPALRSLAVQKGRRYAAEPRELLILVNPWNEIPADFRPRVEAVEDGYEMDVRAAQALRDMLAACRLAGNDAYICSAFRTREVQQGLFDNKIRRVMYEEGVPAEDAPDVAAQTVARPGTSEHELGLAADLIDGSYPYLDEWQENTAAQQWLMANSWRYGFILRYPTGTTDITGIIYEPWHYRYVGPYAQEIYERGLTLEEYLQLRRGR